MSKLVKIDAPELDVIEKSKAAQIRATFEPMADMLSGFEDAYNGVVAEAEKEITQDVTAKAKRLRLDIGKVRIETEKVRKEQKEEYLRAGKAIDGVSNILKWAVTDKENRLKEIENHFEIQEQKRLSELQEQRAGKLSKYVEDAHERDLSSMDEEVWSAYYSAKKKEHEDRIAAERKAEQERIAREKAEAEERERIRKENERLRKEAEEREKQARIEAQKREKEEAERRKKEEAERKEREEAERKRLAKEAEERRQRQELERRLREKEEAEQRARQEEEARRQAELSKGDKAKVADLVADLEALKGKYTFKSEKNKKMYSDVSALISKVVAHIQTYQK